MTQKILVEFLCTYLASELSLRAFCGPEEPSWLACRRDGPECKEFISLRTILQWDKEMMDESTCFFMICRADFKGSSIPSLKESPAKLSSSAQSSNLLIHSHAPITILPFSVSFLHPCPLLPGISSPK